MHKKWELYQIKQTGLFYYGVTSDTSYIFYCSYLNEDIFKDLAILSNKMRNESIIISIDANFKAESMFKSLTFNHTIQVFDIRPFNIHQYLLKIERIFFNHHFTLLYNDSCSIPDAFEVFRHKVHESNYEPESLALLFY